ncbi:condensation domain-containing protein, partial [Pseudomonas sp. PCH446]
PGHPFEQVVEALKPPRSASYSPVFQTMLYTNAGGAGGQLQLPGLNLEFLPSHKDNTQHDLSLHIDEGASSLSCSLSYSTALFDASTVERLAARFERLLRCFTEARKPASAPWSWTRPWPCRGQRPGTGAGAHAAVLPPGAGLVRRHLRNRLPVRGQPGLSQRRAAAGDLR